MHLHNDYAMFMQSDYAKFRQTVVPLHFSVLDRRNGPSGYIGVAVTYSFSQVFLFLQIECAGG